MSESYNAFTCLRLAIQVHELLSHSPSFFHLFLSLSFRIGWINHCIPEVLKCERKKRSKTCFSVEKGEWKWLREKWRRKKDKKNGETNKQIKVFWKQINKVLLSFLSIYLEPNFTIFFSLNKTFYALSLNRFRNELSALFSSGWLNSNLHSISKIHSFYDF